MICEQCQANVFAGRRVIAEREGIPGEKHRVTLTCCEPCGQNATRDLRDSVMLLSFKVQDDQGGSVLGMLIRLGKSLVAGR